MTMQAASRRPPPQVTGISPKEGQPGTQVTIRGEHLGVDAKDLIGKKLNSSKNVLHMF